jgi:ribosomal-protein-alanine N-acetyltransferase
MDARGKTFPIKTERLTLRLWRDADREPFAAMCADPRVMEFLTPLPGPMERDSYIGRVNAHWERNGFGIFVLEEKRTGIFAGLAGLKRVPFEAYFTPAVEIAWRLPSAFWGSGLASEAAKACLDFGFGVLKLNEIVAYTVARNIRSEAVMKRLGMTRNPADDFIFPGADGQPSRPCLLYRIKNPANAEKEMFS